MPLFQHRLISVLKLIRRRFWLAATTWPSRQDGILIIQLLGLYALVSTPVALLSDLTTLELAQLTWQQQGLIMLRVFLFPALIEEGFWRVLLLPHKTERVSDRRRWLIGLPSLILFVAMHPLNGLTLYTDAESTFTNPFFLSLTTLLGLMCMVSYWRSGSWWVPTIIHWVIVAAWLLVFGGYGQLHAS
ncbi:CPBP family glutamic-type intramembrane protease [Leptolyngbya iicbica]|uniref:CPBP family intramembrane metalloprotease n=2 Tax=Cyanophyceae TaxID=3028117 RepID=A0A4Q7E5I3_9CYAN|nr:CPBP family glutamic-type intramembrane protease [Leptolyngbya sp. LK]RZM77210.1 CPBP family intramembrane metalloprotease [Leptolyngbya sp. LK]